MRSSLVAFVGLGFVVTACSVSTTDNSITFKTQPEYVDSSQPAKTSAADWAGEEITINNDGVNPLTGTGGVEITVDPNATKITASAVFAARADTEAEAQESIRDAIGTFNISEGGSFAVSCKHGGTHGTSKSASSGCKLLRVTIPAGTEQQPVRLTVGSGIGGIRFNGAVTASYLKVDENGVGDVDVKVTPVKGAEIIVTGENVVSVSVPSDFSAEQVVLNVNEQDDVKAKARIITTDFPGMESGKPFPADGATANAARTLNVQSKGLLDDYTVTIRRL